MNHTSGKKKTYHWRVKHTPVQKGHPEILAFDVKDTRQRPKKNEITSVRLPVADVYGARQQHEKTEEKNIIDVWAHVKQRKAIIKS